MKIALGKQQKTLQSSKTKDGSLEKYRKHFSWVTSSSNPEQLRAGRYSSPSRDFIPRRKERRTGEPQQASVLWTFVGHLCHPGLPQSFVNADPSWQLLGVPSLYPASYWSFHCSKTCSLGLSLLCHTLQDRDATVPHHLLCINWHCSKLCPWPQVGLCPTNTNQCILLCPKSCSLGPRLQLWPIIPGAVLLLPWPQHLVELGPLPLHWILPWIPRS